MAAPSTASSRGEPHVANSAFLQLSNPYGGEYSFGGLAESHLITPPSLHCREASSFPGFVLPDDTVNSESAVGIKPGDSSVVIGYQVDAFTFTWLAEQLVAL